jgi:hypothetical protein
VNSTLQIEIFNLQGQLIETLFSGRQESGSYEVEWNASHLASGVYYYRLKTENFLDVKKMILIK